MSWEAEKQILESNSFKQPIIQASLWNSIELNSTAPTCFRWWHTEEQRQRRGSHDVEQRIQAVRIINNLKSCISCLFTARKKNAEEIGVPLITRQDLVTIFMIMMMMTNLWRWCGGNFSFSHDGKNRESKRWRLFTIHAPVVLVDCTPHMTTTMRKHENSFFLHLSLMWHPLHLYLSLASKFNFKTFFSPHTPHISALSYSNRDEHFSSVFFLHTIQNNRDRTSLSLFSLFRYIHTINTRTRQWNGKRVDYELRIFVVVFSFIADILQLTLWMRYVFFLSSSDVEWRGKSTAAAHDQHT